MAERIEDLGDTYLLPLVAPKRPDFRGMTARSAGRAIEGMEPFYAGQILNAEDLNALLGAIQILNRRVSRLEKQLRCRR